MQRGPADRFKHHAVGKAPFAILGFCEINWLQFSRIEYWEFPDTINMKAFGVRAGQERQSLSDGQTLLSRRLYLSRKIVICPRIFSKASRDFQ